MAPRLRVVWTLLSLFVVESVVFGLAIVPAALFWEWHLHWSAPAWWTRIVLLAMALVPAYLVFLLALMALSALACRACGWRTPPDAEMRIRDLEWPLLGWVRYLAITHVVRVFAGTLLRATPLWTMYLRLNGAHVGKGVFVNSLAMSDHNLLELGDGTVIGDDVHLSGHTIEDGLVKTGVVRVGRGATIGIGSVIGIGVEIGDGVKVGALSVVPKLARLDAGGVYVGAPARRLDDGLDVRPPTSHGARVPPPAAREPGEAP